MSYVTYRYKAEPRAPQHAALRSARWHAKEYRNACLEERIGSYRAAKAAALRAGRDKVTPADWLAARRPHATAFLAWQNTQVPDLRRRHDQAEARRIAKATAAFENGDVHGPLDPRPRPWRPQGPEALARAVSAQDQMRNLAEIRTADPDGIGRVPLSVLREHALIVDKSFTAFFKRVSAGRTPGFPRFKSFDQVTTLECPLGDGISFERSTVHEDGSISACRLRSMMWAGGLHINMHRPLPAKPKRISLSYDGRFWWVSFLVETPDAHVPHHALGTILGADVGVNRLVTLECGTWFENPRFLKSGATAVAAASRRLARTKRGSRARQKVRRALSAAHRRVRNRRNTWRHTDPIRLGHARVSRHQGRAEARPQPRPLGRVPRRPRQHDPTQG